MQFSEVDYRDIQGLARFGFGHLKEAVFLLERIADPAAARAWLAAAPVTTAIRKDEPPQRALQVAFTFEGLQALGLSPTGARRLLRRVSVGNGGAQSLAAPRRHRGE